MDATGRTFPDLSFPESQGGVLAVVHTDFDVDMETDEISACRIPIPSRI